MAQTINKLSDQKFQLKELKSKLIELDNRIMKLIEKEIDKYKKKKEELHGSDYDTPTEI